MSESICHTDLPIRETLFDYVRDTYVQAGSRDARAHATEGTAGGVIDCRSGVFDFDIAPGVIDALRDFDVDRLHRYIPPSEEGHLKEAIVHRFRDAGVTASQLFFGHGSFNLLERLIHKFLRPDTMGGVGPQFSEVPSEFIAAGGRCESLPLTEPDASLPVAALERRLDAGAWSVLYIDNPNNPLGRAFPLEDLARLAAACDRNTAVLLIDEAFGDYVEDAASAIHLVPHHRNVIVVRSFSKALGLAGERIGYMLLGGELARVYRQIDVPFEPGVVAQTLACATLADPSWLDRVRREVRESKQAMVSALGGRAVRVLPTHPDVAMLALHAPGRDLVKDLWDRGVAALAGSSFARTHPAWDNSYCRLRVIRGESLAPLCQRLGSL
jgi:histidinol-phosphate aminotransferase